MSQWHLCHSLSQPFPPNLQNIITPKPWELECWNLERMFTPHQVSCLRCRVSDFLIFFFYYFFLQSACSSWWRVSYQRGLPRLGFTITDLNFRYYHFLFWRQTHWRVYFDEYIFKWTYKSPNIHYSQIVTFIFSYILQFLPVKYWWKYRWVLVIKLYLNFQTGI